MIYELVQSHNSLALDSYNLRSIPKILLQAADHWLWPMGHFVHSRAASWLRIGRSGGGYTGMGGKLRKIWDVGHGRTLGVIPKIDIFEDRG